MKNTIRQERIGRMTSFCRKGILSLIMLLLMAMNVVADIEVTDVKVFSGYPWREIAIGYTIKGTDADLDVIQLKATDKSANKTYTIQPLAGATLTEGRHVVRWDAASAGVKFSSSNVEFSVSIVRLGVQLWENGPYWAECNVGATKPEECGYYFWWGDTVGYKRNSANNGWVSVKGGSSFSFSFDNCPTYDKYDYKLHSAGYTDGLTDNLVAKYDAATAHLGAPWRMPTGAEFSALISNCDTEWTTRNGVYGRLVTGRGAYASKSIFLPAAGNGYDSSLYSLGSHGYYMSSTPDPNNCNCAWGLLFDSSDFGRHLNSRYYGQSVRPVRGFAK